MDQDPQEKNLEEPQGFEPPKPIKLNDKLHSFELHRDYTPPDWAGQPSKGFFLEILKNGSIIGQVDISKKSLYLVGKLPDLCDIVMEHQSISRKHAVLQHKNDGNLFIYDLGSTYGVKVNQRDVSKNTFHKLNLGDVIKFGQSSRLYVLGIDGKTTIDDYDDAQAIAEAAKLRNDAPVKKEKQSRKEQYQYLMEQYNLVKKTSRKVAPQQNFDEVSWGMVDEAVIYAYEDEEDIKLDTDILRQLSDLTPKDLEKIDNYEKKLSKFQNLEKEFNDLTRREQAEFGLTEEDKQRKNHLEGKVTELRSQVEIMEDNLRYQLLDEAKAKGANHKRREEDTFGDDEFFDRTLTKKHKKDDFDKNKAAVPEAETFDSLKRKLEDLITERNDVNDKILKNVLNLKAEEEEEEVDALDQFMFQNEENLKKETKQELIKKLKALNSEVDEVQKLLRIVKPDFNFDIKQYERKLEEKKKVEEVKKVAPKQETKTLTEKIAEINPHVVALTKELAKNPENPIDEGLDSLDDQDDLKNRAETKNKVYGAAPKPVPRNIKENEYESSNVEGVDWTPPVESNNSKHDELRKRLGY